MTRWTRFLALLAVAALRVDAQQAPGVPFDPSLFASLRWRNIGPNRPGRSLAVAGSPSRPYEYYSGQAGGGLWKTTDGGTTWKPVTDGQIRSSSVNAVAVAESNPDVLYIGMGESEVQRDMLQGDGAYKSVDAGKSWTHVGLDDTHVIAGIRVHPRDPNLVYVAAQGHFYGPNAERGVYRSRDGGKSWQRILFRDDRSGAIDLAMDRGNPDILFAALWQYGVVPAGAPGGGNGPGSGLFKSTNGGDSWTEITRNPGLPTTAVGRIGVAISGADGNRVYALVEAEGGGVFRSDDGGATWTKGNDEGALRQRPSYFNRIAADPNDRDVVYVENLPLFRSIDGGKTFRAIEGGPHVDHHDLWIAPNDSRRLIDANDGGPTVSINRGESWTGQAFPTAQIYRVATTRDVPYHVCGAQQDESAICVPSSQAPWRSTSPYVGSGDFSGPIYAPGSGEFGMVAPHPRDPNLFFGTGPAVITRYDRRTGLSTARDVQVSPAEGQGADAERFSIYSLAFSHRGPDVLYTSSQHVWRTADGGSHWERMSPDLSRAGVHGADGRGAGSVFALAPSYHDANTLWAGTTDGLVHITRDGGKHWRAVTPPELPGRSRVALIEASPSRPGTAYVVARRFEFEDRSPYIFRTDDYGRTWKKIVLGIPSNDFVHAVREDPKREGLLYAGTEHGVFVSFDDGAHWQSLGLNLPDTQVPDLVVERNDLVIATHGRSFYVLDDIGPLRALSPQVTTAALHLFKPRDAIRRLSAAVIDYVLKAPAPRGTIDILDAGGHIIRSFTGGEDGAGAGLPGAPSGGEEEETATRGSAGRPAGRPGLNRFTWDLRYAGATVFPGMIMWVGSPNGPLAPPGRYSARVSANGETRSQPFTIVRDPRRADLTDADVQAQFELALKIRDRISDADDGVRLIRHLRGQLLDRVGKTKDRDIASLGESMIRRLSAIEGELYQVKLRSELDAVTYPIMLNNRLANLKLSIETGDGRPTAAAVAGFETLSSELDVQLGKLRDVRGADLVRFNALLSARRLDPVTTIP